MRMFCRLLLLTIVGALPCGCRVESDPDKPAKQSDK